MFPFCSKAKLSQITLRTIIKLSLELIEFLEMLLQKHNNIMKLSFVIGYL